MVREAFNDSWRFTSSRGDDRMLDLPHDATIEGKRSADALCKRSGAFYEPGVYTYEKEFEAPAEWEGKRVFLEFEGVYPTADVYLNGDKIGGCRYGYSTFWVELKDLRCGSSNTVKVVADDSKHPNSRWYAGAGIYRPVWIMVGDKCAITPNGIRVTTESYEPALVSVEVETLGIVRDENIRIEILDGENVIAGSVGYHSRISIPDAKLWDAENPNLYTCRVQVRDDAGQVIDTASEKFGIRKLEWSAKGFFVNGSSVKLKGGCIHSDNGILGARSYAEAEWRRVKRLKEFGYNAIRSAHNPLCRAALEACDALGMYVMDETWDTWYKTKNPYDFGVEFMDRYETDIRQLVDKDYNHPSVVMYSVGNEITEPAKKDGVKMAETLVKTVKKYDVTRPVTAGVNITLLLMAKLPFDPMAMFAGGDKKEDGDKKDGGDKPENTAVKAPAVDEASSDKFNAMVQSAGSGMNRVNEGFLGDMVSKKVFSKFDICGYNYGVTRYEKEGKTHPDRVIVGSETYCQELGRVWPMIERLPYVIGDFMWTSWDYLGEAGIGGYSYDAEDFSFEKAYPWKLADSGALDILGNDNAEAGLAKVVFEKQMNPYISATPANHQGAQLAKAVWRGSNAMPGWSYKGCEGNDTDIEIYSAADSVEVFINDRSLGRKKLEEYKAVFSAKYERGCLKAVAYDAAGNAVGENSLESADDNTGICITCEEKLTDSDIVYFDIDLAGANGVIEMNADTKLTVSVEGGRLLAFGSADPKTEERYLDGEYTTYYGRAQAIVKKTSAAGRITVTGGEFEAVEAEF